MVRVQIVELWYPLLDCYAQYAMAERYSDGLDGVDVDNEQATALWDAALPVLRELADNGDPRAQYPIALVYQAEGLDMEQGMKWWTSAALAGHALAQNDLGDRLVLGNGDINDCDEVNGITWYHRAAHQGLSSAYHNLGDCYRNGWGVNVDMSRARYYYQLAVDHGLEASRKFLTLTINAVNATNNSLTGDGPHNTDDTYTLPNGTGSLHNIHTGSSTPAVPSSPSPSSSSSSLASSTTPNSDLL
jgi:hypothetical protein